MLRKPVLLAACVVNGASIERGTDPIAAWCRTYSTSLHTVWHVMRSRMSPRLNLKFSQRDGPTLTWTCVWFFLWLVVLLLCLSSCWLCCCFVSTRLLPMKPAAPVLCLVCVL